MCPRQQSAEFLATHAALIPPQLPIISTSKGLNSDTLETMHEIIPRALGRAQVRFCRYRFCATGELKYTGAVG